MSKVYEALQQAQELRRGIILGPGDGPGVMAALNPEPDHRRPPKVRLTVYGRDLDGFAFYENAEALRVHPAGGVLQLRVPVSEGQDLLLYNIETLKEQLCRIIHSHVREAPICEVIVSFTSSHPDFWQVPQERRDMDNPSSNQRD